MVSCSLPSRHAQPDTLNAVSIQGRQAISKSRKDSFDEFKFSR